MMNKVENIKEAIMLLKDKEILYIQKNEMIFFAMPKDKILVKGNDIRYFLSEDEFIDLFQNEVFTVYENASFESVDHQKDVEYYSWQHK